MDKEQPNLALSTSSEDILLALSRYSPVEREKVKLMILDALEIEEQKALKILKSSCVSSFEPSQDCIRRVIKNLKLWAQMFPDDMMKPPASLESKVLEISEIFSQITRKRIFKIIEDGKMIISAKELDQLHSDMENLVMIGSLLPSIDLQCLSGLGAILCDVIGFYSKYINENRESVEDRRKSDPVQNVLIKKRMLDSIRITAFRLRSISNHYLDLICLQSAFRVLSEAWLPEIQMVADLHKLKYGKLKDRTDIIFFVSHNILENPALCERFCSSAVNSSSELASELLIVCRGNGKIKSFIKVNDHSLASIPADSTLGKFILSGSRSSVNLVAKSILELRLVMLEMNKGGCFDVLPDVMPLHCSGYICQSFVCIRDLIHQRLSDLCLKISLSIASVTYEDRYELELRNLGPEVDQSALIAVGYVFQFLLDNPYKLDSLQKAFEVHVGRGMEWIDLWLGMYARRENFNWTCYFLIRVLEYLNSALLPNTYQRPKEWDKLIDNIEAGLQIVMEIKPGEGEEDSHDYIVDQGLTLLKRFGRSINPTEHFVARSQYPDQQVIEEKNFFVFSYHPGSRSDVYKCLDMVSRKIVIIKKIPRSSAKPIGTFRSEIDLLKTLNHINIVKYYNHFETGSSIFLVMEYCDSPVVTSTLKKSPDEVKATCRQILLGLSYLHANHIVHRDIKPSNILKNGAGFVKLADFGEARLIDDAELGSEETPKLLGTPNYMAPECLYSWSIGPSSDIWSFACVFVRLLTGTEPWSCCRTKFNVLFELGSTSHIPYDVDSLDCDREAKAIIKKMLDRDHAQRPTAAELLSLNYFSDIPTIFI